MRVKPLRWIRRMIARTVMGIGGLYVAIDPEMMDEIVAEAQERQNAIISHGMTYEQLKKIEDEWVKERIIN